MTYTTQSGDTWDVIAHKTLGDSRYTEDLINANRQYITTFIFSAGVKLEIPAISKTKTKTLPPWKR
ncbi:MAG: tail protein X [Selenomonadaceae bacterium]|nr:tail protein X [Selenomonadaceae bacterium]